jgi:radical SAM protein with 4Fe4S-binding SPASM domain
MLFQGKVNLSRVVIKKHGENYLVSYPHTGAVSLFNSEEVLMLPLLLDSSKPKQEIQKFLLSIGNDIEISKNKLSNFLKKIENDGWVNTQPLHEEPIALQALYVNITTRCNLTCPYCFNEFSKRQHGDMDISLFQSIVIQTLSINPNAEFIITGGEPFLCKELFQFLDILFSNNASFTLLSNGTLINDINARKLARYSNLRNVQISIDGFTETVNAITRGKNSLQKSKKGIENLIKNGIALSIAPTIHKENIHEFSDIANYAISIGAELSPNNLRDCSDNRMKYLNLDPMLAYEELKKINTELAAYYLNNIENVKTVYKPVKLFSETGKKPVNKKQKVKSLICGMAKSLVNIDWNGDVYPCHMLIVDQLRMGNIQDESLYEILEKKETKSLRVLATDIEKCRDCDFVQRCAGGCRAGAYHTYGSLNREDSICEVLYKSLIDSLKL